MLICGLHLSTLPVENVLSDSLMTGKWHFKLILMEEAQKWEQSKQVHTQCIDQNKSIHNALSALDLCSTV
jgi:hypothetical protein